MKQSNRLTWEETRQVLLENDVPEKRLPNEWQPRIDLSGLRLRGANLRGAYLREVNLAGTDLSHADLSYSDLTGATFV